MSDQERGREFPNATRIWGSRNSSGCRIYLDHEDAAVLLPLLINSAGRATDEQRPRIDRLISVLADLTTLAVKR
jgi:hypothetical protein